MKKDDASAVLIQEVGKMFAAKNIAVKPTDKVVFATAASEEKNVLNAKPEANCALCKELVWVSPSTKAAGALNEMFFVCTICLKPVFHHLKKVSFQLHKDT